MATLKDAWYEQERRLLDLRRRVEALEQRAAQPAPAPAPAPAADRPLWEVMVQAWNDSGTFDFSAAHRYAAEIDAVAEWLEVIGHFKSAVALRAEARRAREGA